MTAEQQPPPTQEQPPVEPAGQPAGAGAIPTWEYVVMASGALALIASFLAFYKFPSEIAGGIDGLSWSAWESAFSLFPVATLAVLYVVVAAAQVPLERFAGVRLPDRVAGFSWSELRLAGGLMATLVMLGYLLRGWPEDPGLDKGIGLYLATLAAIGLVVGAVMERAQGAQTPASAEAAGVRSDGPSPAEIAIMAAGAVILIASFLAVLSDDAADESRSAWAEFLFPLFTIPALLGAAMAAQVALARFTSVALPRDVLGLTWDKVHLVLGVQAAVMMVGLWIGKLGVTVMGESSDDPGRSVGFWLMLLAALVLAGAAIARYREPDRPASQP